MSVAGINSLIDRGKTERLFQRDDHADVEALMETVERDGLFDGSDGVAGGDLQGFVVFEVAREVVGLDLRWGGLDALLGSVGDGRGARGGAPVGMNRKPQTERQQRGWSVASMSAKGPCAAV